MRIIKSIKTREFVFIYSINKLSLLTTEFMIKNKKEEKTKLT